MEKDQRWEELQQHMEELREKLDAMEDRFKPVKDLSYEIYNKLPRKWRAEVKTIHKPHRVVELTGLHLCDIKECLMDSLDQLLSDWMNRDDMISREPYERRIELLELLEEINRLMAD